MHLAPFTGAKPNAAQLAELNTSARTRPTSPTAEPNAPSHTEFDTPVMADVSVLCAVHVILRIRGKTRSSSVEEFTVRHRLLIRRARRCAPAGTDLGGGDTRRGGPPPAVEVRSTCWARSVPARGRCCTLVVPPTPLSDPVRGLWCRCRCRCRCRAVRSGAAVRGRVWAGRRASGGGFRWNAQCWSTVRIMRPFRGGLVRCRPGKRRVPRVAKAFGVAAGQAPSAVALLGAAELVEARRMPARGGPVTHSRKLCRGEQLELPHSLIVPRNHFVASVFDHAKNNMRWWRRNSPR